MTKILDETQSNEIAQKIKSKPTTCFDNAYQAALSLGDCLYVQGFLVYPGAPYQPVEYGWVEVGDRIIDPTLPHLNINPAHLHYIPAQYLSLPQLRKAIEVAQEDYPEDEALPVYGNPPYEYYGDVMLGGKDYQAAYEQAQAKCREINRPAQSNEQN